MFASLFDQSSILVAYSFNFIGKSLVFFSILFFNHSPHLLIVRLTLQNYCYILLKLVSMSKKTKKSAKKCTFFSFSMLIRYLSLPNLYRTLTEATCLHTIHLIGFLSFFAENLHQFFWFYHANICTMCAKFLNKIKGRSYKIFKIIFPTKLTQFFLRFM